MSLTPPARETFFRRLAIALKADEARTQGAHYLTGCYGACPGNRDPVIGRDLYLVEDPTYANLGVHAAEIRSPKVYRCAGRFGAAHGARLDDCVGRRRLREYEAENTGRDPSQYSDIDGLYPRCAQHPIRHENWHVLGEDCRGRLHFDCVGLVNWAVSQVVNLPLQFGIRMWGTAGIGPVEVEDPPFTELLAGDILVRPGTTPEHIALVGLGGKLIEAVGIDRGVIESPQTTGYLKHARLTNDWLVNPVLYADTT